MDKTTFITDTMTDEMRDISSEYEQFRIDEYTLCCEKITSLERHCSFNLPKENEKGLSVLARDRSMMIALKHYWEKRAYAIKALFTNDELYKLRDELEKCGLKTI